MSDTITNEALRGSFGFTRKVSVRQYESAEAFINIQFEVPADVTTEEGIAELQRNAKFAAFQAKALVFEELGLEFEVTEGGAIRELLKNTFGNVTEVATVPATSTLAVPLPLGDPGLAGVATTPPFSSETRDKDEKAANQKWAKARLASHPNEFFDNRPKKASGDYKSTAPDFKHKDSKVGVWA